MRIKKGPNRKQLSVVLRDLLRSAQALQEENRQLKEKLSQYEEAGQLVKRPTLQQMAAIAKGDPNG